jgi:hypothetical protein
VNASAKPKRPEAASALSPCPTALPGNPATEKASPSKSHRASASSAQMSASAKSKVLIRSRFISHLQNYCFAIISIVSVAEELSFVNNFFIYFLFFKARHSCF